MAWEKKVEKLEKKYGLKTVFGDEGRIYLVRKGNNIFEGKAILIAEPIEETGEIWSLPYKEIKKSIKRVFKK
jgi:hypothetical protein